MNEEGVNIEELQQMKQIEQMKKQLMSKMLTKDAYERLARVRAVNPQLAAQAELYLVQVYQTGRFRSRVDDEKIREILKALTEKKQFNIKRV